MGEILDDGIFVLNFPHSQIKATESTFDTCIWLSIVFEEDKSSDSMKKKMGKKAVQLLKEYSSDKHFLTILETVSWEFSEIISHKCEKLILLIRKALIEAKNRIDKGEKKLDVAREFTAQFKSDPHFNSFYEQIEKSGKGFLNLLSNENLRKELYMETNRIPTFAIERFDFLTQSYERRWIKDNVSLWALECDDLYILFRKETTKIGQQDRLHLIACLMLCCSKHRPIRFITFDEKISKCGPEVLEFLNKYKKLLEKQFKEIIANNQKSSN